MTKLLAEISDSAITVEQTQFDSKLGELRLGRRLQKVTRSIENFLENQLARLESALNKCEIAEEQNSVLQRMMVDFEKQKRDWEAQRLEEEQRLFEAGEKLMQRWEQLEYEKRKLGLG